MSKDPEISYDEVHEIMMECVSKLIHLGLPDIYIAIMFIEMGQERLKRLKREQDEGTKH